MPYQAIENYAIIGNMQSTLIHKLLTFEPTGAIVAALTFAKYELLLLEKDSISA